SSPVILVEFYATWCPHCQAMMPVVERVREQLDGRAAIAQIDIDKEEAVSDAAGVKSVPTFILYKDGIEKWRHSGQMDAKALVDKVTEQL
ncbi:MAG: thioredoxin family protein, partial [Duncaniella sp.]|nr:thioredoxin family protein [Duncaniella sp.]